ncbi:MAG: G5 domain-containing protein [Clostridiales bacterium]|jgi:uncharacterized protein YabE (DUF348 family)|nr:G5 domain-containing protein [Clostridiales bacterium]
MAKPNDRSNSGSNRRGYDASRTQGGGYSSGRSDTRTGRTSSERDDVPRSRTSSERGETRTGRTSSERGGYSSPERGSGHGGYSSSERNASRHGGYSSSERNASQNGGYSSRTQGSRNSKVRRVGAGARPQKNDNLFFAVCEIIKLIAIKVYRKARKLFGKAANAVSGKISNTDSSFFGSYKPLVIAIGSVLSVLVVILLIWGFTNKNAYEVYLGETASGIIRENKNITADTLSSAVINKISNEIGSKIKPSQEITIKNIHASSKKIETEDTVISKLAQKITYQIEAVSVTLDGTEIALLASEAEYEEVKSQLIAPYRRAGSTSVSEGFVESLEFSKRFVDETELISVGEAVTKLGIKYSTDVTYTVKSGDVMGSIAHAFGTTVDAICEYNGIPVEEAHRLSVGQIIKVASEKPMLSVQIVEEVKTEEAEEYETERRLNPNVAAGSSNVLQEGKNGLAEIVSHVTFVNGAEVSREQVSRTVTVAPVTQIVEVGSGN